MSKKKTTIDPEILEILSEELDRQENDIELIASENYTSQAVLTLTGSIMTNKYAEGYPNRRYYGGCEYIDQVESLAIERAKKIFAADHANVQPHSGSQANAAAYQAILKPGDKVLAMDLSAGGHLTHGAKFNFSGIEYSFEHYGVNPKTGGLDYRKIASQATKFKPKLIVAGASAYPLAIDFEKFSKIAKEVGAYLMVDMAHIAGLVAAGVHQNPVPYADIVTSTTHKTLRGPRGGLILCKKELAAKIDKAVFPGQQGGPLEHVIAAKAQCFYEAAQPEFIKYQKSVITNCKAMAKAFKDAGFKLTTSRVDNHMLLLDTVTSCNLTGKQATDILHKINIIVNPNLIPNDQLSPAVTSGIRIGTPAITTRGFKKPDATKLAEIIIDILKDSSTENVKKLQTEVYELVKKHPVQSL